MNAPQQTPSGVRRNVMKKVLIGALMLVALVGVLLFQRHQNEVARKERLNVWNQQFRLSGPPGVSKGPPLDYSEDTSAALLRAHLLAHVPRSVQDPSQTREDCAASGSKIIMDSALFWPGETLAQPSVQKAIDFAHAHHCWVAQETRFPAPDTPEADGLERPYRSIFPVRSDEDRLEKLRDHTPDVPRCGPAWSAIAQANAAMTADDVLRPTPELQTAIAAAAAAKCWY